MTVLFHNATFHHKSVSTSKQGGGRLCNWLLLRPEWHTASHTTHHRCDVTAHVLRHASAHDTSKHTLTHQMYAVQQEALSLRQSSSVRVQVSVYVTDRDQRFPKVLMWTRDFSGSRSQVVRIHWVQLWCSPSAGCNQSAEGDYVRGVGCSSLCPVGCVSSGSQRHRLTDGENLI